MGSWLRTPWRCESEIRCSEDIEEMEFLGAKMLFIVICISLIIFSGSVAPAYKVQLDSLYGRIAAVIAVIVATEMGGWPIGILTAMVVLILMPATVSEGFIGTSLEGFVSEPFTVEVDKPTTDKNRWFIERVMKEKPKRVERDNIITLAPY